MTIVDNYTDNIEDLWIEFNKNIQYVNDLCKNMPGGIKKTNNLIEYNINIDVLNENEESNFCKLIDSCTEWTEWSIKLTESIVVIPFEFAKFIANVIGDTSDFILNITEYEVDVVIKWINDKLEWLIDTINTWLQNKINKKQSKNEKKFKKIKRFIKKAIKRVKILLLKANKLVLSAQLWVYKTTKRLLERIANGKMINGVSVALKAVIDALKVTAKIITYGLSAIQSIVEMLSAAFISIKAGHMAFFLTPKIALNGRILEDMAPIEQGNDLFSFGAIEAVDSMLNEYIDGIKNLNDEQSKIYISNKVAEYLATGNITEGTPVLQKIDQNKLSNIVQNALNVLLTGLSEPLPKYEKLSITNIRFLLWLSTVFEPGMKASFGLPGMP